MGVNLAPLLASAGVAGVAIGLAAQNIVKDMLNGILILIEDQFNVGDKVRLAGLAGTVEAMTLRKTTVRDGDGTLYVIPNSQITTVANLSVGYSVATINVSVDFSANPDEVMKLLKNIAMDVRNSDEFKQAVRRRPADSGRGLAQRIARSIFPVLFKTLADQAIRADARVPAPRAAGARSSIGMLPGDPNRVFQHVRRRAAMRAVQRLRITPPKPEAQARPSLRPTPPRSSRRRRTRSQASSARLQHASASSSARLRDRRQAGAALAHQRPGLRAGGSGNLQQRLGQRFRNFRRAQGARGRCG